jgi:hypothetical protein
MGGSHEEATGTRRIAGSAGNAKSARIVNIRSRSNEQLTTVTGGDGFFAASAGQIDALPA